MPYIISNLLLQVICHCKDSTFQRFLQVFARKKSQITVSQFYTGSILAKEEIFTNNITIYILYILYI